MRETFGLKAGHIGHDRSGAVGEQLFTLFKEADVDAIITKSSVCNIQLLEGTGLPFFYPPLHLLILSSGYHPEYHFYPGGSVYCIQ